MTNDSLAVTCAHQANCANYGTPKTQSVIEDEIVQLLTMIVINFITDDVSASSLSSENGKVGDTCGIAPPNTISSYRFVRKTEARSDQSVQGRHSGKNIEHHNLPRRGFPACSIVN